MRDRHLAQQDDTDDRENDSDDCKREQRVRDASLRGRAHLRGDRSYSSSIPDRVNSTRETYVATRYRHPVNKALIEEAPLGARVADRVTGFMGSWRFIIYQTVVVVIWLGVNIYLLSQPFDPFPFILLNLAFSTQAAYAAPLILLAGNRAASHDRMVLEHAASQADVEEKQNEQLIARAQESLKHLIDLAERTLAIEEAIKTQGENLLRLEQAILAFESEEATDRHLASPTIGDHAVPSMPAPSTGDAAAPATPTPTGVGEVAHPHDRLADDLGD